MTGPTIREATPADVADVRAVATGAWPATYAGLLGPRTIETALEEWYGPETVQERVTDEETRFLVADDGRIVVGFASAGPVVGDGAGTAESASAGDGAEATAEPAAGGGAAVAELRAIYVSPARQREGIGSALAEEAFAAAREDGFDRLLVRVLSANERARAFYRDCGFEPVREESVELFGEATEETVLETEL